MANRGTRAADARSRADTASPLLPATDGAPVESWRRPAAWLPLVAVGLLGVGMALVVGGVVARGLFMPGVYVLGLGFLAAAAAGAVYALPARTA
jgi:hypothetical protein